MFLLCSHQRAAGSRGSRNGLHFRQPRICQELRERGVPDDQAEAHAEAARDFIMAELVTKADLLAVRADLLAMKQELQTELRTSIETQTLRLTIRLGAMLVVAIGALATILKLA
jgi:hypothetical protein